jgi:hypothetical protein
LTYATGGLAFTTGAGFVAMGPYANRTPLEVRIQGVNGYVYTYIASTGKIEIRQGSGGGFTPAGTISSTSTAPTITTSSGGVTVALGVAAGALSEVTGATGITGVQAPTITSTFTGSAGTGAVAPLGELPASSIPAGVSGDTITFVAVFPRV